MNGSAKRLISSKQRPCENASPKLRIELKAFRLTTPERSLEFDSAALEDLSWWIQQDRKKAQRIIRLVQETAAEPFGGIGKPEPLKHELAAGRSALTTSIGWSTKSLQTVFES